MAKAYTIEQISEMANSRGVKLLSTIYCGREKSLDFECSRHGNFSTTLKSFIRTKYGCSKCAHENVHNKQRMELEKVRALFIQCGYEPLFDSYERAKQKLPALCPKHGRFEINYDNLKQGKRCHDCARESAADRVRLKESDFNLLVEELAKKKIKPLFSYEEYLGLKEEARFECEIHGEFTNTMDTLKYREGCRKCTMHHSGQQDEMTEFIKGLVPTVIENTRKIIKPFEIDIFSPEHKIGIEYGGLWWHCERYKDKKYHKNKKDKAKEQGVNLITVFEDEWRERSNQIKGYLCSLFGHNTVRIHARKTELKEVQKEKAKEFLETYHIQGSCDFLVAFGLYYESELVGVMTAGKHHRNSSKNELILNRMVFKNNVTIVGGASKLLNTLKKYAKSNNYEKIISWSDNRWSEGNVYQKIGFTKAEELKPDYSYIKKEFRFSKQSLTKKRLTKLGATGKTEKEMALSLGYRRIWDCGKIRWELVL